MYKCHWCDFLSSSFLRNENVDWFSNRDRRNAARLGHLYRQQGTDLIYLRHFGGGQFFGTWYGLLRPIFGSLGSQIFQKMFNQNTCCKKKIELPQKPHKILAPVDLAAAGKTARPKRHGTRSPDHYRSCRTALLCSFVIGGRPVTYFPANHKRIGARARSPSSKPRLTQGNMVDEKIENQLKLLFLFPID